MDPSGIYANCQVAQQTDSPLEHECTHSYPQHLREVVERKLVEKNQKGWRRVVLNFTPSWFSVIMGTGISSILLHNLPYNGRWLYWTSVVVFCWNICLFVSFLGISILRYTMFRGIWSAMLRHPVQSLFLGTFPMGLATIVNMMAFVCVPAWGPWATSLTWALWWVDVVISIACCMYMPFIIMSVHESSIQTMTAVWLLPIVSTIVAAASGGIVAAVLPNPQHALWTLIVSYVLWGTGVPLAMVTLVLYFHRLTMHFLPPREVIVSVFLPLGPLGQGGFGIMQLGKVALEVMPKTGTLLGGVAPEEAGRILYVVGWVVAMIMWGYGCVWLFFAIGSITRSKFPFNMGWWGFTFPLGVFTTSTTQIAAELPSRFFKVLGTIFSISVVLLWLLVSARTLEASLSGRMFFAPCVAEYEQERVRRELEHIWQQEE